MGWLWVWLRDRQERRAGAAVRRQSVALAKSRRHYRWPQDFETDGTIRLGDIGPGESVRVVFGPPQMASSLVHETDDALRRAREEIGSLDHVGDLLAECRRADALAGKRGGFVTTARIRDILRGKP